MLPKSAPAAIYRDRPSSSVLRLPSSVFRFPMLSFWLEPKHEIPVRDMNISGCAAGFSRPRSRITTRFWFSYRSPCCSRPGLESAGDQRKLRRRPCCLPPPNRPPIQLQQLVGIIALYPDSLVAQILAASTFPEQLVEADRWVQAHPDLKGDALAAGVDQQPGTQASKRFTAFPSVLGNMDEEHSPGPHRWRRLLQSAGEICSMPLQG